MTASARAFELSPQQRRTFDLCRAASRGTAVNAGAYRAQALYLVKGASTAEVERLLGAVFDDHEIYRAQFSVDPNLGVATQQLVDVVRTPITHMDCRGITSTGPPLRLWHRSWEERIDLAKAPLARATVLDAGNHHLVQLTAPATSADLGTLALLARAIEREASGDKPSVTESVDYLDVAEFQNERLRDGEADSFGPEYLRAGLATRLPFETPGVGDFRPRTVPIALTADASEGLSELASGGHVRPSAVALAAWVVLLRRLTLDDRIVVAAAYDAREIAALSTVHGPLSRLLPLAFDIDDESTFADLVARAGASAAELPGLHRTFRWPKASTDRVPFAFEEYPSFEGPATIRVSVALGRAVAHAEPFTAKVAFSQELAGYCGHLHYDSARLKRSEALEVARQFGSVLSEAVQEPDLAIRTLSDRPRPGRRVARRQSAPPRARPFGYLDEAVAHHAALAGTRQAVVCEGDSLTYAELDRLADTVANALRAQTEGTAAVVGLRFDPGIDLVVAVVGVLRAGCAYLPIDPDTPHARAAAMLGQADARLLVDGTGAPSDRNWGVPGTRVTTFRDLLAWAKPGQPPHPASRFETMAYVIFTSGSTGQPKGVAVEHASLTAYVAAIADRLDFRAGQRFGMLSSYSTDLANTMLFGSLIVGGTLVLASRERVLDPQALAEYFREDPLDVLKVTPSQLEVLLSAPDALPTTTLVVGGEGWATEVADRVLKFRPTCRVINHYGPTETTVGVLVEPFDAPQTSAHASMTGRALLGLPLGDTRVYVLSGDLSACEVGQRGEIYIGGHQVARGYVGAAAATAERFVPDPHTDRAGARMYRTGDLGRLVAGGRVEFLGRADRQVKVRGHRVELGDVEATLSRHPAVAQAAVEVHDGSLVAYVVPVPESRQTVAGFERYLLAHNIAPAHVNAYETEFFFEQMFTRRLEFQGGIRLPSRSTVVDVGANIGLFTILASLLCPDARVIAVEPLPPLAEITRANAGLYAASATVLQQAVGASPGQVVLDYVPGSTCQSGSYTDQAGDSADLLRIMLNVAGEGDRSADRLAAEVARRRSHLQHFVCEQTTISRLMQECGVDRIDLLKIDAERSESEILAGISERDWPRINQVVVEVHDIGGRLARICEDLRGQGFDVSVVQDPPLAGTNLWTVAARRKGFAADSPAASLIPLPQVPHPFLRVSDVRSHARELLPGPMVPASFVIVPRLALTASGKVDWASLRERLPADAGSFSFEGDAFESVIAEAWISILEVPTATLDDNFFDIGGHSLLLFKVQERLQGRVEGNVSVQELMDHPSIRLLAAHLRARQAGEAGRPLEDEADSRRAGLVASRRSVIDSVRKRRSGG